MAMAGFSVRPAALAAFANTLCSTNSQGNSGAGPEGLDYEFMVNAPEYTDQWVRLPGGSGGMIFSGIVGTMDSLCDQLTSTYQTASQLMVASAMGLTNSAGQYQNQDYGTAQHLDTIYKPSGIMPLAADVDTTSPTVDPASSLTTPGTEGAVPDFAQQILDSVGYFSESELVLKILSLCGLNVEDWVKQRFVGDYQAVARCRNAIVNLSKFDNAAATLIAGGLATMLKSWQGTAATAARSYFDQLANGIAAHADTLSSIAQKLDALVVGIQQGGSTVIGLITAILDYVAELAAAAAAAGCLQEVPGVDVLIDIVGAWKVTELINKIHELGTIWGYVWGGLQGMMAAITSLVGVLQNYTASAQFPAMGYANAAQGQQPVPETTPGGRHG